MSFIYTLILTFSLLCASILSANAGNQGTQIFIVRIQNDLKPYGFDDDLEWYKTFLSNVGVGGLAPSQSGLSTSTPFVHVYRTVFPGFSARMTSEQANALRNQPGVLTVFPDTMYKLQTTRTPNFLGLDSYHKPKGLLMESDLGSNIVIGIIDTGIDPGSPSFHDEGLGPIPSHFRGTCDGGLNFSSSFCNRKLVGVRYYSKGQDDKKEPQTARDFQGHGTHTASTAAGRAVNASFFGYAQGEATGIAPKARLSIYKVCWEAGCASSDILAAFDDAVSDGVDIISISVGGDPLSYARSAIAVGAFAAAKKGIFVSASAGNSGPTPRTVSNCAPWITTVGAGLIDRTFPAQIVLGNGSVLSGASLYTGKPLDGKQYFPIAKSLSTCEDFQESNASVKGKIAVCERGYISVVEMGVNVKNAGGVGFVALNGVDEGLQSEAPLLPGLSILKASADKLVEYLHKIPNPKASMAFFGTKFGNRAPVVAWFSSRGPHFESDYLLKPDIIAPGLDILAAWPEYVSPSELSPKEDPRKSRFNIISGTSMAAPHVSGIAALLKGAHPDWSPAVIRSALMTTSYNRYKNGDFFLDQSNYKKASIWATGAGHVNPVKADDPGLVFDIDLEDYIDFLCSSKYNETDIKIIVGKTVHCSKRASHPWELNYPAIVMPVDHGARNGVKFTVTRTVTNVGAAVSSYSAVIVNPRGSTVAVNPPKVMFKARGEKQSFSVSFKVKQVPATEEVGWLTWNDGQHNVTIPLIVAFKGAYT